MASNRATGAHHRRKIGLSVTVYRGRHGHDDHSRLGKLGCIAGKTGRAGGKGSIVNLIGGIVPLVECIYPRHVDIKANDIKVMGKGNSQGQAHITQTNHSHGRFFCQQVFK